jgi:hypothetical protein
MEQWSQEEFSYQKTTYGVEVLGTGCLRAMETVKHRVNCQGRRKVHFLSEERKSM